MPPFCLGASAHAHSSADNGRPVFTTKSRRLLDPSKLKSNGYTSKPADRNRARNVTIPNIGGFAGISFKYADAKLALGYRADLFFNAMDGGIDTRKSENVGFYGPFATVSVGLGG